MKLLNPWLKKLHVDSLAVPNWVVFLKQRPFVKQNKAEFTNASSFTSPMCSTHLHCLAWCYLTSPPATILSSLCLLTSPESLSGESCLVPLGFDCFSGNHSSSELNSFGFWTSDTSCRKFLYIISCLCLVFCTQKYIERCTD